MDLNPNGGQPAFWRRLLLGLCELEFYGCLHTSRAKGITVGFTRMLKCALHSPASKALVVPFNASNVSEATMSACLAIVAALSTASAPMDVISWVPLMRANPSFASRQIGLNLCDSKTCHSYRVHA